MKAISVGQTRNIPVGTMKGLLVENKQILIANVDGTFYAMDAICSHMGGYLPGGTLENSVVTCPVHHSRFDVTTGKFLLSASRLMDLNTYEVIMDGDEIKIRF